MNTHISPKLLHSSAHKDTEHQGAYGVFAHAACYGLEELHFHYDQALGLKAIVAIHNTCRGPALGGTRCLPYETEAQALTDVARLAHAMSYKSAFARLPYGGGKAVILRPPQIEDPDAFFEAYGAFIDHLNGRYVTTVDVGTRVETMDIIARKTRYVLSTSKDSGDPSESTAQGVLQGILAAAKIHLKRTDLETLRVLIQGVGKVGGHLARLLHERGARLSVCDNNPLAAQACVESFGATLVDSNQIFDIDCDVLSPCAMGGAINADLVKRIKAKVVCGAANNQLASVRNGDALERKDIFYVPDFVVNAGGLIHVVYGASAETQSRISAIYDAVIDIYQQARAAHQPPYKIANQIAERILSSSRYGQELH